MNRFDASWFAAIDHLAPVLTAGGLPARDASRLQAALREVHLPGRLIVLAEAGAGSGPVGPGFLSAAAAFAAAQPAVAAAGLDDATVAAVLRALLVERASPTALPADEALQAQLLDLAARHLADQGVTVSPAEARTALHLLASGEFFADAGATIAAVAHLVPTLPVALGRDVPRLPLQLGRLLLAILADAPGLGLGAAGLLRSSVLDGAPGPTPAVMTRTMRVLYDMASIRSTLQTLRTLVARDNASVRLALILYARANGVPLTAGHLDALHDTVLDPEHPDLGPVLAAVLERYLEQHRGDDVRRMVEALRARAPGTERALREAADAVDEPDTRFEGIVFRMRADATESPQAVVARALGPGWHCVPFARATPRDFEAVPDAALAVGEGWDCSYALGDAAAVERAEPRFETHDADAVSPDAAGPVPPAEARSLFGDGAPDPAADDPKWSPRLVRAFEAWQLAPAPGGARFGEGIVVGQPDTGYTAHREIEGRLVPGWDFLEDDGDAVDPLDGKWWLLQFPGHGTGTASVLVSPDDADAERRVTGVAPAARLMPLRVSRSVIHLSMANVAKALYYAVDRGCHVVSMSLGGLGFGYLHDAVRYAVERGVILVAAAGNQVHVVVHPAAYEEVIAVAGCDVRRRPWSGSSRGPEVDIAAPAARVWKALATRGHDGHGVSQSDGTSFATATVAGVAALWLAYHGRPGLIARYGAAGVPALFKWILTTAGWLPGDWDGTAGMGPGIVDARAVLEVPLPERVPAPRAAPARWTAADEIARQLRPLRAPDVLAAVAAVLGTDGAGLEARLHDAGPELVMHLATDRVLRERVRALARGNGAAARGAAPVAPDAEAARTRLARIASSRLESRGGSHAAPVH